MTREQLRRALAARPDGAALTLPVTELREVLGVVAGWDSFDGRFVEPTGGGSA